MPRPVFTETHDGKVLVADGVNKIKIREPYGTFRSSGIDAPTLNSASLGGTGDLNVAAVYVTVQARTADGRVSNVSGVSGPYGDLEALTQEVITSIDVEGGNYNRSGDRTLYVSDTSSFTIGKNVTVRGVFTTDKTLRVRDKDTDWIEVYTSSSVGWANVPYIPSSGIVIKGYSSLSVSATAPSDTDVAYLDFYRTKVGGDGNAYYLMESVACTPGETVNISSTAEDADLGAEMVLQAADGSDRNLTRHGKPPVGKRVVIQHGGRIWCGVDYPSVEGVVVGDGTVNVAGVNTEFNSNMVGMEFFPRSTGSDGSVTISSVTDSTNLVLDDTYSASSGTYMKYSIRNPIDERRTLYFSEVGLPESFDPLKTLTIQEGERSGEMTALIPFRDNIFVMFEYGLYLLSYQDNPATDGYIKMVAERGCLNQYTWVAADEYVYVMDYQGIYRFSGGGVDKVSAPIQPMFSNRKDSKWKIHTELAESFHSVYDPREGVVRFFVSLDGSPYPKHALAFQQDHNRWWIEEYPLPITASCLGEVGGVPFVMLATTNQRIAVQGASELDVVESIDGELRGACTDSTDLSIDSSTSFPDAAVGAPITIVSGTGKGQTRIITAKSGAIAYIDLPWTIRPDTTSVYQLGGINYHYQTGWFKLNNIQNSSDIKRGVCVLFEPIENDTLQNISIYRSDLTNGRDTAVEFSSTRNFQGISSEDESTELTVDMTRESGFAECGLDGGGTSRDGSAKHVSVKLSGTTNNESHIIRTIRIDGASQ